MQIEFNERMRVIFTGSKYLIDQIQKVPSDKFPFITTIEQTDDRFDFT
jgi:hypothetical protein